MHLTIMILVCAPPLANGERQYFDWLSSNIVPVKSKQGTSVIICKVNIKVGICVLSG